MKIKMTDVKIDYEIFDYENLQGRYVDIIDLDTGDLKLLLKYKGRQAQCECVTPFLFRNWAKYFNDDVDIPWT